MSFSKNKLALGLLAAVVIASGCTDTGSSTNVDYTQTTGITIEEFDAFPNSVMSGTQVQLNTRIKNTGGATADNVQLTVFNIPEVWGTSGFTIEQPETIANSLQAPDPDSGIPSTPVSQSYTLTAPDLDQGVVIPYDIMGQISYEYSTTGVTKIVVMGQERWRRTQPSRSTPSVDNTGGPVQVSVNTKSPIIFQNGSPSTNRICVQVRNVGNGVANLPSGGDDSENRVQLTHTSQSSRISLGPRQNGGLNDGDGEVRLDDNGRGTTCYSISVSGSSDNLKTTVPITFTANYIYEKETSTSVTVQGTN